LQNIRLWGKACCFSEEHQKDFASKARWSARGITLSVHPIAQVAVGAPAAA
jgi:hypothetical protein